MSRAFGPAADDIIPIPIRADLTVYVAGLPMDMTPAEAAKIGRVIAALADADTTERQDRTREDHK